MKITFKEIEKIELQAEYIEKNSSHRSIKIEAIVDNLVAFEHPVKSPSNGIVWMTKDDFKENYVESISYDRQSLQ